MQAEEERNAAIHRAQRRTGVRRVAQQRSASSGYAVVEVQSACGLLYYLVLAAGANVAAFACGFARTQADAFLGTETPALNGVVSLIRVRTPS